MKYEGVPYPDSLLTKGGFSRATKVNLWESGTIAISKIVFEKLEPKLLGMDANGVLVPTSVTGWHHNGRQDSWIDIEVNTQIAWRAGTAGYPNKIRMTANHNLIVNGESQIADKIRPGDTLIGQTLEPSEDIVRVVKASLLGDGTVINDASRTHAKYMETHSGKQREYIEYLRYLMGSAYTRRMDIVSGYGSLMLSVCSGTYITLKELRDQWYDENGVKFIPNDLSWIDDFAVAKWIMDDGHLQKFKVQADRLSLATHSFKPEDIERLGDRLTEMYGVSYHLVYDRRCDGYSLVVNSGRKQQILPLWEAITPYIVPSLRYKVPEAYRDMDFVQISPGYNELIPKEVTVLSVTPVAIGKRNFPDGHSGFSLSTETGNFFVKGALVQALPNP